MGFSMPLPTCENISPKKKWLVYAKVIYSSSYIVSLFQHFHIAWVEHGPILNSLTVNLRLQLGPKSHFCLAAPQHSGGLLPGEPMSTNLNSMTRHCWEKSYVRSGYSYLVEAMTIFCQQRSGSCQRCGINWRPLFRVETIHWAVNWPGPTYSSHDLKLEQFGTICSHVLNFGTSPAQF